MVNILLRHISISPARIISTYHNRAYYRHATANDKKKIYTWSIKDGLGWRPYSPILFGRMYKHYSDDNTTKDTRGHSERKLDPLNGDEKLRAAFDEYFWNKRQALKAKTEEAPDSIPRSKLDASADSPSKLRADADLSSKLQADADISSKLQADEDVSKILNILVENPSLDPDTLNALIDLVRTQTEFKLSMGAIQNRNPTSEIIANFKHSDLDFDAIITILKNAQMGTPGLIKQLTEILSIGNQYKLKMVQPQMEPKIESKILNKTFVSISIIAAIGIIGIGLSNDP